MSCPACKVTDLDDCVASVPAEVCIRLQRGSDNYLEFILTDGQGEPVDLTPDSVKLTIKDEPGGTEKLSLTNDPGEHVDPTNGKTGFTIASDAITETGTDQLYWVYEVRRIQPTAEAVHITGPFVVDPSI